MSLQWDRIKSIFLEALERSPQERHDFVVESCAGDRELLHEVETLLKESEQTAGFLEAPITAPSRYLASSALRAGDVIADRFHILKELGTGGMGVVYQARDRETGTTLALKLLRAETAGRPAFVERLKTELVLARKITHRNVCRVYDLVPVGNDVSISMEYVEGENLRAILDRRQGLSVREGLKILRQVLAGLIEAHAQGVIHRDLKPENILIAHDGTVKLTDFGIARSIHQSHLTGVIAGTPAYMSPEQATGKPADARSDIYSLGLVMYEIFCGRRPVLDETGLRTEQMDSTIPSYIGRISARCLEVKPSRRFQSASEVEAALNRQEAVDTVTDAASASVPQPAYLTRWQRTDWLLLIAAVAGIVVFLSLIEKVHMLPRVQIPFEPVEFGRIAEGFSRTLGAPQGKTREIQMVALADHYNYLSARKESRTAPDFGDDSVPFLLWRVRWNNGTQVELTNEGALMSFARDVTTQTEALSLESAQVVAAAALKDILHANPSNLRLQAAGDDVWRGHAVKSFTWSELQDHYGLLHRYNVRVSGSEIASLESSFIVPASFDVRPLARQMWGYIVIPLIMMVVGFSQRRLVDLRSKWRIVLIALLAVVLGRLFWLYISSLGVPLFVTVVLSLNSAIAVAFVMFFTLTALERGLQRIGREKLVSTVFLFGRRALSETCGLGILRGTLIGLGALGALTLLNWAAITYLPMWMDGRVLLLATIYRYQTGGQIQVAIMALSIAALIGVYVSWLASVFVRRGNSWRATVLSAIVIAVILPVTAGTGTLQPYPAKIVFAIVEYLIWLWVLSRFDFLTMTTAIATLLFCNRTYSTFAMLRSVGPFQEVFLFVVWGLVVALAISVAFKSQLMTAHRRMLTTL